MFMSRNTLCISSYIQLPLKNEFTRCALTLLKPRLLTAVPSAPYFRFHIPTFALHYLKPAEAIQTQKTV